MTVVDLPQKKADPALVAMLLLHGPQSPKIGAAKWIEVETAGRILGLISTLADLKGDAANELAAMLEEAGEGVSIRQLSASLDESGRDRVAALAWLVTLPDLVDRLAVGE